MPTMLVYVTFALTLVLILRRPARQLFGAAPAFTLWLLPPLLALLPWLPRVPSRWLDVAPAHVFPVTSALAAQLASPASSLHWSYLLWAIGTSLCLVRLVFHYRRVRRQSHPLPDAMLHALESDLPGLDMCRVRLHPAGPAVLWAPRSVLLLPADFLDRFDARQRQLVLRHEITHLRRGDAVWSLLGELMLALLWFHPLAWLAMSRLRLDQELACDEQVLRQSPQDEAAYAHTLLHSTGMNAMPMSIPWRTQPQLKERLHMIQRHRPGSLRRRTGFIALAVLMASTAWISQAATSHAQQTPAGHQAMNVATRSSPVNPRDAITNKEQATVVLDVLVGTDGKPLSYKVDPTTNATPELIWAAGKVAMQSHYNPKIKNGKPIEAYARVPITFNLSPTPPAAPPPPPPPPPPLPPPPPSPNSSNF